MTTPWPKTNVQRRTSLQNWSPGNITTTLLYEATVIHDQVNMRTQNFLLAHSGLEMKPSETILTMHNDRPSITTAADLKPKNAHHAVASYWVSTYMSTSKYDDFFRYTKGQWLQDGEKKLSRRYQEFNVEALKRIAIESVGAKSCSTMTKISESGYNRVFKLTMDNGSVAIARIPIRNLCPDSKATASEVATMDFARTILDIPVPKVYAWNTDSNNPVGTDYIIMEEAPGISLAYRNYESHKSVVSRKELVTELASKQKFVADIVAIEKKLLSIVFKQLVFINAMGSVGTC
ncbi:hypothetical protein BOTCAL_0088g00200 [Botryotinia calthae]|uniref:Altered inheritance of mitochondria protein 9, mitochondrial n=1 Tax=Botryotinia calthae TaxID=38488 RepID=A0A4Y8D782_9HELO|nr:hypothetical protein BOTCAL_0088g00200 [Botryotinia calthae]